MKKSIRELLAKLDEIEATDVEVLKPLKELRERVKMKLEEEMQQSADAAPEHQN